MRKQVPVLVHGAALDRHAIPDRGDGPLQSLPAIHDQELRAAQATTDEIIENTAPGFAALPTHALDRQQYFLAIRAHADDDQQRDCGRLAVEPHVHPRAVENEPHNRFGGQRASIPGVPIGLHLAF